MFQEILLVTCTIFFWGTLPSVTKLALTSISNMQTLWMSSTIATVCLLVYLIFSQKIKILKTLSLKDYAELFLLGFIGNFLYSALYYASLRILPSADASIINYLWPVIASLLAAKVLKEKIGFKGWFSLLLSFGGVLVISTKGEGLHLADPQGVLLCTGGAVCYGIFNVFNKKKGLDQYVCTTLYFAVTALCSGITFFLTEDYTPVTPLTWGGLLVLGIFIDALAILTWGLALQKGRVSTISNMAYTTPLVVMLISYFTLHEPITLYAFIGLFFILGGVFLQLSHTKKA